MSMTGRDRKIVLALIPLLAVLAYWFLLLAPKRDEASKLGDQLSSVERKRDDAVSSAASLEQAAQSFPSQYASVVRLGKAIPDELDMPALLLQLNKAARGTGIGFDRITVGERTSAAPAAAGGSTPPGGGGATPAQAGGTPAQSTAGKTAERAGNAVNNANTSSTERSQLDSTTSKATRSGGLPVGGGATNSPLGADGSGVAGLDTVKVTLSFHGEFFSLADFFHRVKRFVRIAGQRIRVGGRLITIDGFSFKTPQGGQTFDPGDLQSELRATVYLVPKSEGVTLGATPAGPAPTPASSSASKTGSATPTAATVTP
jgi:hypothetical protein